MLEPVIIVHGTFASKDTWWRRGSDFSTALDRALAAMASPAKCWGSEELCPIEFSWSGLNSDRAREQAAQELASYVNDLVASAGVSRIHVVCHSHGGNVFLHCANHLTPRAKIAVGQGIKVFLGTPFYNYGSHPVLGRFAPVDESRPLLFVPLLALLAVFHAVLPFWLVVLMSLYLVVWVALDIPKFLATPFFLDRSPRTKWQGSVFHKRNAIFSFAADEALVALQVATSYWHRPVPPLQTPTFGKWQGRFSLGKPAFYWRSLRYFSAYAGAERLTPNDKLSLLAYLSDETRSLCSFDLELGAIYFILSLAGRGILLLFWPVAAALLLFRLVILVLGDAVVSGAAAWLSPIMLRMAMRQGLRAAATTALGLDRVGYIVAAIDRVPSCDLIAPPADDYDLYSDRVDWQVVPIPEQVEREVNSRAVRHISAIVEGAYASRAKESAWLAPRLDQISAIFSDVQYTHNMYYRHPWVIDGIAVAISKPCEDIHPVYFLSNTMWGLEPPFQDMELASLLKERADGP